MWQVCTGNESGVKYLFNITEGHCIRFKEAKRGGRDTYTKVSNLYMWMINIRSATIQDVLEIEHDHPRVLEAFQDIIKGN